jgi:hypothetical protein
MHAPVLLELVGSLVVSGATVVVMEKVAVQMLVVVVAEWALAAVLVWAV